MSHRSVVQLIKDVAVSLSDDIQFGYGRKSDFNLTQKKRDTFIWMITLTATPTFTNNNNTENYQKTWNVVLYFFRPDQSGSTEIEFKPILDDLDILADRFVQRLNDWSMTSADVVGAVTLRNFQQTPYIKDTAEIYTGWFLSFQMVTSDDFDYCKPENVAIYDNN